MDFYEKPPSPEDENASIDYETVLPYDQMMPMDYKFDQVPLFESLLESKKAGTLPQRPLSDYVWLTIRTQTIESPSQFYFTLPQHVELQYTVHEKLREFFGGEDNCRPSGYEFLIPPRMVKIGMAVVACRDISSPFTRCYVERMIDKDLCIVREVDSGSPFTVYKKNLHFIPKWLAEYPAYCYCGKLTGVKPMGGKNATWRQQDKRAFAHLVCEEDSNVCSAVVRYFTKNGTAALYICNSRDRWVDDEMVYRLAAVPDTTPMEQLDRASRDKNEQMALIEDLFSHLPKPHVMKKYGVPSV